MNKQEHINQILDRELEMFMAVKTYQYAACRDDPDSFRTMRTAQFSVWSQETLARYSLDLKIAAQQNRNLMTLKYARMDNLIPPLNNNPLIDNIVDILITWQKEMTDKYPNLIKRGRPLEDDDTSPTTSFTTYMRCELETYSDQTLANLLEDIRGFRERCENMTEKIYEFMVKGLGYRSIEEADKRA